MGAGTASESGPRTGRLVAPPDRARHPEFGPLFDYILSRRTRRIARLALPAVALTAALLAMEAGSPAQAQATYPVRTRTAYRPTYTYVTPPQPAPVTYTQPAAPSGYTYTYTQPAAAQPTYVYTQPAQGGGDASGGFLSWLNATRAQYGLSAVGYDSNLASWAAANNDQQNARGLGHFVMGPARRQNSAMGNGGSIGSMWMNSPAHRAALLDPSIRFIGLAGSGMYWTFNAY